MKKIFFCVIAIAVSLSACNSEQKSESKAKMTSHTELAQIYHKSDSLYKLGVIDTVILKEFIDAAVDFADKYPEDKSTPDFLTKAGLAGMMIAKVSPGKDAKAIYAKKSLGLYDRIIKTYPDFQDIKISYLNKGIIYDDILERYEDAEYEYREFLQKFPNDSAATGIRLYLEHLGKSPEEIMSEFPAEAKVQK